MWLFIEQWQWTSAFFISLSTTFIFTVVALIRTYMIRMEIEKKDADTEYGESKDVAADRISKETAELVNIPPYTVERRSVKFLLNQKKVYQNIERVPLNTKLLDSIEKDGLMNPILTMPNYYPIAGSQRMRALLVFSQRTP